MTTSRRRRKARPARTFVFMMGAVWEHLGSGNYHIVDETDPVYRRALRELVKAHYAGRGTKVSF